jgi:Zn-dependent protease with chaperone function
MLSGMEKITNRRSTNFFARQEQARRNCRKLVFFFIVAVFGIIVSIYFAFRLTCYINLITNIPPATEHSADFDRSSSFLWWDPAIFILVSIAVTVFVLIAGMIKMRQLQKGGGEVAQMLGGRLILTGTDDPTQRQLLNVVEEMAIASGIPVPLVFVLDKEAAINAFAAGLTINDAAITVTRGSLDHLNRDELQGVIAHEFSHILNGDMRLNMQLIGIIYGIMIFGIAGGEILEHRRITSKSAVLFIGGLLLTIVGYMGTFAGRLIQSAVSRQKEFLADASAVQFTRNPAGLAGALKKIGGYGSQINSPAARQASHLFLGEIHTDYLFPEYLATHPPLIERIMLLDPSFDGTFPAIKDTATSSTFHPLRQDAVISSMNKFTGSPVVLPVTAKAAEIIGSVGNPTIDNLDFASTILASLPEEIKEKLNTRRKAATVIWALLMSDKCAQREILFTAVQQSLILTDRKDDFIRLCDLTASLKDDQKLPVVELAMPSLRGLTVQERRNFLEILDSLIRSDEKVTLFEFCVQWIVRGNLVRENEDGSEKTSALAYISQVGYHILIILRALANAGNKGNKAAARLAFNAGVELIPELACKNPDYFYTENINFAEINTALKKLACSSFKIKKVLVDACAHCVFADKTVTVAEAELLRIVCLALHCPLPPFAPDKS